MKVAVRSIMTDKTVKETETETVFFDWGWIGIIEGVLQISIVHPEKYNIYNDYPGMKMELNIKEAK